MEPIGYQVQNARRYREMKVEDLAEAIGMASGTIRAIEQGRRNPSLETIKKLETALKANFDYSESEHAPFSGAHIRKLKSAPIEENTLRLQVIQLVMNATPEKLAALQTILQD